MSKGLAILSGGLDSTVLAYRMRKTYGEVRLLSFNYNQRHKKELEFAKITAERLGAKHDVVDLSEFGLLLKGSALTDDITVPEGHYAEASMAQTIVPNRNAIMLALAFGVAVAERCEYVGYAAHAGDHPVYPDCRPEFVERFDSMEHAAIGMNAPVLLAPFIQSTKADIVRIGDELGVPFETTWSCYQGGAIHCGRCGTCVERKEAFRLVQVIDPTEYEDEKFVIEAYRV